MGFRNLESWLAAGGGGLFDRRAGDGEALYRCPCNRWRPARHLYLVGHRPDIGRPGSRFACDDCIASWRRQAKFIAETVFKPASQVVAEGWAHVRRLRDAEIARLAWTQSVASPLTDASREDCRRRLVELHRLSVDHDTPQAALAALSAPAPALLYRPLEEQV